MSDIENIRKLSSSYVIWLILLPFIASFCYQFDGIFIGCSQTKELRNAMIFSVLCYLLISVIFYSVFIYLIIKNIAKVNNQNVYIFLPVLVFFVQNFTNDMIYSPDMVVMLLVSLSLFDYSTKSLDFRKS